MFQYVFLFSLQCLVASLITMEHDVATRDLQMCVLFRDFCTVQNAAQCGMLKYMLCLSGVGAAGTHMWI